MAISSAISAIRIAPWWWGIIPSMKARSVSPASQSGASISATFIVIIIETSSIPDISIMPIMVPMASLIAVGGASGYQASRHIRI